jgi:tRNA (guanine37-N1)-methyltransferase
MTGPSAPFTIRACAPDDAPALAALGARLFVQAYGSTHPEPALGPYLARSFDAGALREALARPAVRVLVAEDARGAPIGYAQMREARDDVPAAVGATHAMEIERFYVEEGWHGRGVARSLMDACVEEARRRGAEALWLQVWREAPRPQAFYRKSGFEVVGDATFRFGDRVDDDWLMARRLR